MSFTTIFLAACLPVVCIAAAWGMMHLFDVKQATAEQARADAEKLLSQVNREVKVRRVRAGTVQDSASGDLSHFSSLRTIRTGFRAS